LQKKTENLEININDEMLENIISVLNTKEAVKIGVLGKSQGRSGPGPSNVELAVTHEFGKGIVPRRSFLRLTANTAHDKFQSFIDASANGIFKAITENRWHEILELFGAKWTEYVHDTFEAQGYGTWPKLKPLTVLLRMARANPKKLSFESYSRDAKMLQDTGALLRSITHEVVSE
jgi:phage gpG-like protein